MRRMVPHEARARLNPQGSGSAAACCTGPTAESRFAAGVAAPGGRRQAAEGGLGARAECQAPARRREPRNRAQARGLQHAVKPAASTDLQRAGRAAHATAKPTPLAQEPKRAAGCGEVCGAARVPGPLQHVTGPCARPGSAVQVGSCRPKAKSNRAQRESAGIVVSDTEAQAGRTRAVRQNVAAGKGRCGAHAVMAGKRGGSAGETAPKHCGELASSDKARQLPWQRPPAAQRAARGRMRVAYPAGGNHALSASCPATPAAAQPLPAGAGPQHAASRRPLPSRVRQIRQHALHGDVGSVIELRA
jgi:hypothetical protein